MNDIRQLAKLEFVAFCIEQYKNVTNQTGSETEQMFKKHGIIKFLNDHYDILHTQSAQQIQDEIVEYINKH